MKKYTVVVEIYGHDFEDSFESEFVIEAIDMIQAILKLGEVVNFKETLSIALVK